MLRCDHHTTLGASEGVSFVGGTPVLSLRPELEIEFNMHTTCRAVSESLPFVMRRLTDLTGGCGGNMLSHNLASPTSPSPAGDGSNPFS